METETRISLSEYFGNEASGFTPWLAKNKEIIEDIIGEKLQVYKREAKIKNFYIDLMLRNENKVYVVENQYGESNHDHFGKIIIYSLLAKSAGTVWIAESFLPEYEKIIETIDINLYFVTAHLYTYDKNGIYLLHLYIHSNTKERMKQIIYKVNNKKIISKRVIN